MKLGRDLSEGGIRPLLNDASDPLAGEAGVRAGGIAGSDGVWLWDKAMEHLGPKMVAICFTGAIYCAARYAFQSSELICVVGYTCLRLMILNKSVQCLTE